MALPWKTPIYELRSRAGKKVVIDVTTAISPGLSAHQVVKNELIPFFRRRGDIESVLDFGAGALRHTFPLLRAGFQVCAVEFEEAFQRPKTSQARKRAKRSGNFSALVWPKDFIRDRRKFDAALLCFALQTMPIHSERKRVLKYLYKKLRRDGYLVYMARFGQTTQAMEKHRVKDGYYMWPERAKHSFYREFTTEETHKMMRSAGFTRLRSLGARGTEQIFLYGKGKGTWI